MSDQDVLYAVLGLGGIKAYLWSMDRWVWPRILCDHCGRFQIRRQHSHAA